MAVGSNSGIGIPIERSAVVGGFWWKGLTVVRLIEVGRFGKAWQQVATVAIGGLNAIVGNGLIDERDVVAVDADRIEGVGLRGS